ncbi:MAG: hypothetical protein EOP48_13245 [Sphingobacteriales bacterium]|nr:MAG: hypothetical protein EOP48_13245 [Sphingobacteriales bacterium]
MPLNRAIFPLSFFLLFSEIASSGVSANWIKKDSDHFTFHFLNEQKMTSEDIAFQEKSLTKEMTYLGISPPKTKIQYFLHPDKKSLKDRIDFDGNAVTILSGPPDDPKTLFELHSIYPRDRHEIIHVLLFPKGLPLLIWTEGIAVYRAELWHGKNIKDAARDAFLKTKLSLVDLIDEKSFRNDEMISYPIAGAFVEFLAETYGIKPFMKSYEELGRFGQKSKVSEVDKILTKIYSKKLNDLNSEFKAWLEK